MALELLAGSLLMVSTISFSATWTGSHLLIDTNVARHIDPLAQHRLPTRFDALGSASPHFRSGGILDNRR